MRVRGIEGLTLTKLDQEVAAGGRFVCYEYCMSFIVVSLRRPSDIFFLRSGEWGIRFGLGYALISALFGWWGVPWGFIYTPLTLLIDLSGGVNVTAEVRAALASLGEPSSCAEV